MMSRADQTMIDVLARRLRAEKAAPDGVAPPVAILWTDPERQWLPLRSALLESVPELIVFGDYDPENRTGPAIWLRCMVDRTLDAPALPTDRPPIVYLPGIGRQHLRAGDDSEPALRPLIELMYRGTMWLQRGGHDWTVTAFMTSRHGLELDLARDDKTAEALMRALREVAQTPLTQLRDHRLEAEDFDRLLTTDTVRDLLRWMSDPSGWRERAGDGTWAAFCSQCRVQFGVAPEKDGETVAGERLGAAEGAWAEVWDRFCEAPQMYTGIADLLRRSKPGGLIFDRSRWPDENENAEEAVRFALLGLDRVTHTEACEIVLSLEEEHGRRRQWIWSRLGMSPLAGVLEPLAVIAERSQSAVGGATPDEVARNYLSGAWEADAATWRALASATPAVESLVKRTLQLLLKSWLDDSARAFQVAIGSRPLPDRTTAELVTATKGCCLVFADGLRYDLGQALAERLEGRGCRVRIEQRWAALPTVTATAKPAVTPVARQISGAELPEDFAPTFDTTKKPANAGNLRSEMQKHGYQVLGGSMSDWPESDESRGWTEFGQIDSLGHKLGVGLARQIDDELDRLAGRVIQLLDGGWHAVRVVTDHGWLLLPEGLPSVDLPKHLTASRWSRCATIAGSSVVSAPTASWHWNTSQPFATAPGIACFNASPSYAHGGLSVQECLIPDLFVERVEGSGLRAVIASVNWRGMRCFVVAEVSGGAVRADLRLKSPSGPTVASSLKTLDEDGGASLVVADDAYEHAELVLVLLGPDDTVLAQRKTKVGATS